jgi:hypothetical protein
VRLDPDRLPLHCPRSKAPAPMSNSTIWFIAIAVIVVDLAVFMIPVVPFAAAYILIARPPWFKTFIDDVYEQ